MWHSAFKDELQLYYNAGGVILQKCLCPFKWHAADGSALSYMGSSLIKGKEASTPDRNVLVQVDVDANHSSFQVK